MTLIIKFFILGFIIGEIGALFDANPILTGIIAYIVGYEFDIPPQISNIKNVANPH